VQISSIIDIVDGRLLNHPSISFIYSIKTNPRKVREGDLFIVENEEDIDIAVNNGAFALITHKNIDITDDEIAWIYVDSIKETIKKLIRYLLSNKRLTAFYCNEVSYELFKILKKPLVHSTIKIVPKNLSEFFKQLEDLEENDTLICSDQKILNDIYPVNFNFNSKKYEINNLVEHSIFETSFSYGDKYFPKLKLSSLYIKEFLDVYNFLGSNCELIKLKKFNYLKPIFVDKLINHTDYGKTDKFLIAQNNEELISKEINYLKQKYKYAKIILITMDKQKEDSEYIHLDSLEDLKPFLKKLSFNAAYFKGISYDELFEQISIENIEPSLI